MFLTRTKHYYERNGLFQTCKRGLEHLWLLCFRSGMVVFSCDLKDAKPAAAGIPGGLTFESIACEEEMPSEYQENFAKFYSPILTRQENPERFKQGAVCFLVRSHGRLAGFGWSIRARTREPYFLRLADTDVHLFDFFVFPEFRGQGINPAIVSFILARSAEQGCQRAFIETAVWNAAELASLRKTPFRKLGVVRSVTLFGRVIAVWRPGKPALPSRVAQEPSAGLSAPHRGLTMSVATSFETLEGMRGQWDALVSRSSGDIYMTFDWCQTWWKHYGRARNLQVLLFRTGEELVGILPMFTETVRLWPAWLKVAKLVGSDFGLQICNPPVLKSFLQPVLSATVEHCLAHCGCDAAVFTPLSGIDPIVHAFRNSLERPTTPPFRVVERELACHAVFNLPETFDSYLRQVSKSQRSNFKRDSNLLAKSFRLTADAVADGNKVEAEFESFRQMHQDQWQADGMLGHFGDWPSSHEFNLDLISSPVMRQRVRFYRLLVDGSPVSFQYCFAFNGCLYWRLAARPPGEHWSRYGLGRMGLIKMIEAAIAAGLRTVEGGRGHYDYKVALGARECAMVSFLMIQQRWNIMARYHLFQLLSTILNVVYYKLLFRRIAPKLKILQRPLWPVWIRSRIGAP